MSNYVKNKIRSLFGRKTPDGRKKSIRLGLALGDGGGVNPVPWDVLDECDVIAAVDVLGYAESVSDSPPNAVKAVLDMFDIMQKSIVEARMKSGRPDIYIRPEIKNIGILEFNRAEEIFACAEASLGELKKKLVKYYPEISLSS